MEEGCDQINSEKNFNSEIMIHNSWLLRFINRAAIDFFEKVR